MRYRKPLAGETVDWKVQPVTVVCCWDGKGRAEERADRGGDIVRGGEEGGACFVVAVVEGAVVNTYEVKAWIRVEAGSVPEAEDKAEILSERLLETYGVVVSVEGEGSTYLLEEEEQDA